MNFIPQTCCKIPLGGMYVTRKNLNQYKAGITLDLRIYPELWMIPDNEKYIEIKIKEIGDKNSET